MKTQTRTNGEWKWMSKDVLVGNHGHRPVILMAAGPNGKLVQRGPEGLVVPIDTQHPDMVAIAGAGRLVEAVEAFFKLRTSIFPEVRGEEGCAALHELEEAAKAAGADIG